MGSGTPRKCFHIFENEKITATKYPPICDMESVKVYRNPWVRAELAQTFTIDVVLHDAQNGLWPPTSISLGPRNRGISKITVTFYPSQELLTKFCKIVNLVPNGIII